MIIVALFYTTTGMLPLLRFLDEMIATNFITNFFFHLKSSLCWLEVENEITVESP